MNDIITWTTLHSFSLSLSWFTCTGQHFVRPFCFTHICYVIARLPNTFTRKSHFFYTSTDLNAKWEKEVTIKCYDTFLLQHYFLSQNFLVFLLSSYTVPTTHSIPSLPRSASKSPKLLLTLIWPFFTHLHSLVLLVTYSEFPVFPNFYVSYSLNTGLLSATS